MACSDAWSKTYELNEKAWAALYREQHRRRQNTPLRLLLFVLSTAVQLPLAVAYSAATRMQPGEAARLLLLSASLCLLACLNRYASGLYAHVRLSQPDPSRRYETCTLRIRQDSLSICRGERTTDAPAALLRIDRYRSGLVTVSDADSLLTFVPGCAFTSAAERSAMLEAFEEARKNCFRRSEEELAECVPERCMADYRAAVPAAVRAGWERTAYRGLVRTSVWWNPAAVVSAVASAAILLALLSAQLSVWTALLLALVLVLLNLRYIVLFTPLVDRQIAQSDRQTVSLLGDGEIRYCFDAERLVMIGNRMAFDFPRRDVAAVCCRGEFGVWYLCSGLVLVIPRPETMSSDAFQALLNRTPAQDGAVRRGA